MPNEDLEFEIKVMARDMAKLQSDVRENYGLIKELAGKQYTMERIEDINRDNMRQERDIGSLEKGLQQIADALKMSDDKSLSKAAEQITINVEGGKSDATGSVDTGGGDFAGDDMQKDNVTGSEVSNTTDTSKKGPGAMGWLAIAALALALLSAIVYFTGINPAKLFP